MIGIMKLRLYTVFRLLLLGVDCRVAPLCSAIISGTQWWLSLD